MTTENQSKIIDTKKYIEFVRETTSPASSDFAVLLSRMTELEVENDADIPRLMTAAFGMSAEAGEADDAAKISVFNTLPIIMARSLGDCRIKSN